MSQVQEIFLIGEDFTSGNIGNSEIDIMLGFDTVVCGDKAIRKDDGYSLCPDYCGNISITDKQLEKLNLHPIVLPASHESSKRSSKSSKLKATELSSLFVSVFSIGNEFYVTRPFENESTAQACVLWYALAYFK